MTSVNNIVTSLLGLSPKPAAKDWLLSIYIGVALLALRLACEAALIPVLRKALTGRRPKPDKLAVKVFDDAYTSFGAAAMMVWAWWVMIQDNDGCTPINSRPCLAGWPDINPQLPTRYYWVAMFGFYFYELLGTAIRRGPALNGLMVFHHVATCTIMVFAYFNGLLRLGLMSTALLDLSNPILHAAKALQHLGIKQLEGLKWALFNTFALVFLVARILFPPFTILRVAFVDARVLPTAGYFSCNTIVVILYSMQLFWFYKIVQLALKGEKGAAEEMPAEADKTE